MEFIVEIENIRIDKYLIENAKKVGCLVEVGFLSNGNDRYLLKNNGVLAMVHRTDRLIEIIELFRQNNIEPKKICFVYPKQNKEANILLIETSVDDEITTPNTLIIYKTYYTECKHYIQRYEDIDASLVNLTEKEFKEKTRRWRIEKFSSEEIELSKEEEGFCNEHYKLKLDNNVIVIYQINQAGVEIEYEHTEITTEYLTNEDILKLTTGIEVYGKENLSSTLEDYE